MSVFATVLNSFILFYFSPLIVPCVVISAQILSYFLIPFYREKLNRWEEDKIWFTKVSSISDDLDDDRDRYSDDHDDFFDGSESDRDSLLHS